MNAIKILEIVINAIKKNIDRAGHEFQNVFNDNVDHNLRKVIREDYEARIKNPNMKYAIIKDICLNIINDIEIKSRIKDKDAGKNFIYCILTERHSQFYTLITTEKNLTSQSVFWIAMDELLKTCNDIGPYNYIYYDLLNKGLYQGLMMLDNIEDTINKGVELNREKLMSNYEKIKAIGEDASKKSNDLFTIVMIFIIFIIAIIATVVLPGLFVYFLGCAVAFAIIIFLNKRKISAYEKMTEAFIIAPFSWLYVAIRIFELIQTLYQRRQAKKRQKKE